MYRLRLICKGVPEAVAGDGALEISCEFAVHRTWWENVTCRWDGTNLVLEADSDFDSDGTALLDEFSDCVAAFVEGQFSYDISVESVTSVMGSDPSFP
jgi:hypothetical protein